MQLPKFIQLKPDERERTLVLFLQFFCVVAVTIAGKSARDTYFLSRFDRSYLPLMFAVCAVSVALAATLYSRVSRWLSTRALLDGSSIVFITVLLIIRTHLEGFAIPVLYVWIETAVAIISLSFWLGASEIFDPRQAKRLFGIIGGGGALAAIIVGAGIKPLVKAFGSEVLLWLVIAALALQWGLGRYALRFAAQVPRGATPPVHKPAESGFDPYLISIALVVSVSAIASQVVDYQFKVTAAQSIAGEADLAGFFGNFYAIAGVATLIVQFFLTSALLARFGLLAGLLTLPVFLNLGSIAVLFNPTLVSALFGKFADQTLKFTLNNSAAELLWLPVPALKRKAMRPMIGGTVKYAAESSAGLITFFLVQYTGLRFLSLVAILAILIWIFTAIRLKSLYVKALASALEKRQLDFESLPLSVQDPAIVDLIEKTLTSDDEVQRCLALELMEGLPLAPWAKSLRRCFEQDTPAIRQKILQLAANDPELLTDQAVLNALTGELPVALAAIRSAVERDLKSGAPIFLNLMQTGAPELRAAAASALMEMGGQGRTEAAAVLSDLIDSSDSKGKATAVELLAENQEILPSVKLSRLLSDPSREVRDAALKVVEKRRDPSLTEAVISCLDDPRCAPAATESLKVLPAVLVTPRLERLLQGNTTVPHRKSCILRALAVLPDEACSTLLLDAIGPGDLYASAQAVRSLITISTRQALPETVIVGLRPLSSVLLQNAYAANRVLKLVGTDASAELLRHTVEDKIRQTIPIVLGLQMIAAKDGLLGNAVAIAREGDPAKLSFLLELLDNVLAVEDRTAIAPLLEHLTIEERDAVGSRLYPNLPTQLDEVCHRAVYSGHAWECAIALDYLVSNGRTEFLQGVRWGEVPDHRLVNEVRKAMEAPDHTMYSTLEKTILLKSVSLFADIPVEKLSRISQIVEEISAPKGTKLIKEGDFGDSMFIVADGMVRVHAGGKDLALLKRGDCLGEMALLDRSPRSADATVEQDATLLRIRQEEFDDVTVANSEIMQAIVQLLARRLREANAKLASQSVHEKESSGTGQ